MMIGILGPIIAFVLVYIFVKMDLSIGEYRVGAAFGVAFIGLVILGNGILYPIIGIISSFRQRNLDH